VAVIWLTHKTLYLPISALSILLERKGKVLIVLLVIDLILLSAALVGNGFMGWLFLNIIAVMIWLGISKRLSIKKEYRQRRYFQEQSKRDTEAHYRDERQDTRQYGADITTQRGDRVRSKGEGRLADYFYRNKIRYRYEPPVFEKNARHRLIGCPDFYLYDYDVYVEYWGMSSVPDPDDRRNYNNKRRWKMERYNANGYKVISIEQHHLDTLGFMFPAALKEATGLELKPGKL
jgi:hypothetical protein